VHWFIDIASYCHNNKSHNDVFLIFEVYEEKKRKKLRKEEVE